MLQTDYEKLLSKLRLNERTSEPYYQQLKRKISALIDSGDFPLGQGLPSERVMAELLNISRTTVRRCYEELRESGQIGSHGRAGTRIKAPPQVSPLLGKLKGFTDEMRELGMEASTRLESRDIVRDRTIASIFKRPSTATFLRLVRVRLANDVPMSREVAWYDLAAVPCLLDWDVVGSAYELIKKETQLKLSWAEQSIEAVMSSKDESEVFEYEQSQPCLLLKRKVFANQDQLIEYVEGTFRGDAYAYRLKLSV